MDEIKDTQRTDAAGRFFDTPAVRTNPFGTNRAGERAYRRAERIAAALHLLTNHIASDEPVRASVRSEAVQLIEAAIGNRHEMRSTLSEGYQEFSATVRRLISLVRILAMAGHVSSQNAAIVIEALDELGQYMQNAQRSSLAESVSFSREDLMDVAPVYVPQRRQKDIKDGDAVKDVSARIDRLVPSVKDDSHNGLSGIRASQILSVLSGGPSFGIREIAEHLPEYSEKMIQRELADLVVAGQVTKAGDKRWSRYSLAK